MIVAENVTKYYGARAAVRDVSFTIDEGEVVGLLGLNGAGKTTTLKILSGGLLPTAGRVQIANVNMAEEPEVVRARIGFLPEVPPLYPEMVVDDYLRFVAHIKGLRGNIDGAIDEAVQAAELTERRYDRIDTLSHGYRRRVGIAHAIVHRPALILLDEPTSGLDPVQIVHMRNLIRTLRDKHTILVSSHILSEITQLCDRILVLHEGRLTAEGSEDDLAQKLSGGRQMRVEVRGSESALRSAVTGWDAATTVEVERSDEGRVLARVALGVDDREGLAKALVQADLGLRRLEPIDAKLENIFLQLTGGAPREEVH